MAQKTGTQGGEGAKAEERLTLGGMARFDGLDLYGPDYVSVAYRKKGEIHVRVERARGRAPENEKVLAFARLPIIRSFFFWGRLLLQVLGSVWAIVFFAASLVALWLVVKVFQFGSEALGPAGGLFAFFETFPIVPVLLLFFASMRFTAIGRFHGAEHKVVSAYEKYGEVTLENAHASSRIHPRCGTNILAYILLAGLLDPVFNWWGYAFLQFILISEAWYVFGQSRPSIAVGDFLQRHFTTTEPGRAELEVAVESINRLVAAEESRAGSSAEVVIPARF